MAFQIDDLFITRLPSGFVFGTGAFDGEISPPGGPPPPGSRSSIPIDWVDPPLADDIRMHLELARGLATFGQQSPEIAEQLTSYIDLALSVLYGPIDPAAIPPRNLADLDDLDRSLSSALATTREMRERQRT